MTTLDQDIHLTPEQIVFLDVLARKRIRQLNKTIDVALENRRAGVKIQHGTLDNHMRERDALNAARIVLEEGRQRVVQHFREKLRIPTQEGERQ